MHLKGIESEILQSRGGGASRHPRRTSRHVRVARILSVGLMRIFTGNFPSLVRFTQEDAHPCRDPAPGGIFFYLIYLALSFDYRPLKRATEPRGGRP